MRRHKACGSEFDYLGWEELGAWKERARECHSHTPSLSESHGHKRKRSKKDCTTQCLYPSACHWKAKEVKAARAAEATKNADFSFLDPDRIAQAPVTRAGGGNEDQEVSRGEGAEDTSYEPIKLVSSIKSLFRSSSSTSTATTDPIKNRTQEFRQQLNPLSCNPISPPRSRSVDSAFILPELDFTCTPHTATATTIQPVSSLADLVNSTLQAKDAEGNAVGGGESEGDGDIDMPDLWDVSPSSSSSEDGCLEEGRREASPLSSQSAGWGHLCTSDEGEEGRRMSI
ncbi:uncharacterized protein KY384_002477 [Bacidia gigantensis]|uniref:uncharacterized protein n=1 Tax=Bacidia gigantensis TaxID=2732470 RepID=UPI001D04BA84|nr:uncharacterized protein KY384_002477 [Bacidia gigantensis]KAG8532600.1 hypothetical protein KY384_002477 [Bacidia gigantensis]